jgi:hypothetical protein
MKINHLARPLQSSRSAQIGIRENKMTNRRRFLKSTVAFAALAGAALVPQYAFAEGETIKVGILHSLSGTMAIDLAPASQCILKLALAQQRGPEE